MLADFKITEKWSAPHPDRIQLYSLPTPNGANVSIMLEETGLPYEGHRIRLDQERVLSPTPVAQSQQQDTRHHRSERTGRKAAGKDYDDKRPLMRYVKETQRLLGVLEQRLVQAATGYGG